MKRVLVTGGTIFVSKYIAEHFVLKGDEVYVMNRNTHPQLPGTKLIEGDKTKPLPQLSGIGFDLVVAVNIYTGSEMKNLLDVLDGNFGDIIFISSSAVYPETTELPFSVSDPVGKNTIWGDYGLNKIEAEKELLRRYPGAYILRPPYFYGKYQCIYREAFVFDCAERNMPFHIPEDGSMPLQFYNVSDLCRFIDKLTETKPEKNIYNVGNKAVADINTYAEICYSAAGVKLEKIYVDSTHNQRSYFPFHKYSYYLDVADQYELIPDTVSLYDGIMEEYKYYKAHKDEVFRHDRYFDYLRNVLSK